MCNRFCSGIVFVAIGFLCGYFSSRRPEPQQPTAPRVVETVNYEYELVTPIRLKCQRVP